MSDPKPRKRIRDSELLKKMSRKPCQITEIKGREPGMFYSQAVDTHHLVKHPRHDVPGNLFRILHSLHMEYEQGTRRPVVARLIRAYMTQEQIDYVIKEKGDAWLEATYPL